MNRHRSMAFYLECLLLTVFLLAVTAVLAQLFSAARAQALEARRLTDAQRLAQDVSEQFYAASDEADFCSLLGLQDPAVLEGVGGEVTRTGPSGDEYRLLLALRSEPQDTGRLITLSLQVRTAVGGSVCSLEFVRYWPA